jgi:hypothetical protein
MLKVVRAKRINTVDESCLLPLNLMSAKEAQRFTCLHQPLMINNNEINTDKTSLCKVHLTDAGMSKPSDKESHVLTQIKWKNLEDLYALKNKIQQRSQEKLHQNPPS